MSPRRDWTTKEVETLRLLIAQGYAGTRLSYRLSKDAGEPRRHPGAIGTKARRLGLSIPRAPIWALEEVRQVEEAKTLGLLWAEMPDFMVSAGWPRRTPEAYSNKLSRARRAEGAGPRATAVAERVALRQRVAELESQLAHVCAKVADLSNRLAGTGGAA